VNVALLPAVVASTTEACDVCTDGEVLAHFLGSDVTVVMPCPHCKGWRLMDSADRGGR
jgi:hypothetical protein